MEKGMRRKRKKYGGLEQIRRNEEENGRKREEVSRLEGIRRKTGRKREEVSRLEGIRRKTGGRGRRLAD